nr:MAG TPA: protein of unknown function DUF1424 [Caudoviricetes sp.]
MAYRECIYDLGDIREHEIRHAGKYGAKGERRAPRQKATPEQIKKQNQRNRENYMRRLILLNFNIGDYWVTLKYPKGTRKPIDRVRKDFKNFINRLKRRYKKAAAELKYIYRLEVGERGGIHIHMVINRVEGSDMMLTDSWSDGNVYMAPMYEEGWFRKLAEYIVKNKEEAAGQLSLFDEAERKKLTSYSCSRNLEKPVPVIKEYTRRTVERIVRDGITPAKGFYVDKESVYSGVNPFTGMSFLCYTEVRIKGRCNRRRGLLTEHGARKGI